MTDYRYTPTPGGFQMRKITHRKPIKEKKPRPSRAGIRRPCLLPPAYVREVILDAMGKRCARCSYAEFVTALEFHHVDPSQKADSLTSLIAKFAYTGTAAQWEAILAEVQKCVVLCSNCHQALHQGAWQGAEQFQTAIVQLQMPDPGGNDERQAIWQ